MTERLTADEVNSMDTDIYRVARLAYRLGRQDQQRILEHRLRKHFDSDVQARTLAELAAGMTDDLVDFHAVVRAAEKDSTPVNSPEPDSAADGLFNKRITICDYCNHKATSHHDHGSGPAECMELACSCDAFEAPPRWEAGDA